MNFNALNSATKLDIVSVTVLAVCLVIVMIAAELSAPIIAGLGAVGAVTTGIVRLVKNPRERK